MKRLLFAGIFTLAVFASPGAVTWRSVSAGPEFVVPVGDLNDKVGQGVGVSARFEIVDAWSFVYGLGSGYLSFAEKGPTNTSMTIIPLQGIMRYRPGGGLFYVALEGGMQFRKTNDLVDGTANDIRPMLCPQAGLYIPLGSMIAADVTASFAALPVDAQFFGLRLSVAFGF